MANTSHLSGVVQRRKHTVLLLALILMSLAQPLVHGVLVGLIVYDVILTLVLFGVFIAIFERSHERYVSLALAAPAMICRWASYFMSGDVHSLLMALHQALLMIFFGLAVYVILRRIFEQRSIQADHVVGTVCGYLLAGAAWGSCYSLCGQVMPESFAMSERISQQLVDEHSRSFYFDYYSLCTLTGVGFGDISPVRPIVASLTWLEAMFGQFYLAVVVAQLVGLKLAQAIEEGRGRIEK